MTFWDHVFLFATGGDVTRPNFFRRLAARLWLAFNRGNRS